MAKQTVRIVFEPERTNPPVYICGSFTSPPWVPILMQPLLRGPEHDSQYFFVHEMEVEEGRWEYKIRIGESDWMCDETAPKATNDQGIVNNLLVVEPQKQDESTVTTDNPFRRSSGRSISWELVKAENTGTDTQSRRSSLQAFKDALSPTLVEEPSSDQAKPEERPPLIIDCQVAQAGVTHSPRAINIPRRGSVPTIYHLHTGSSDTERNVQASADSRNHSASSTFHNGSQEDPSMADIGRVRYIMAMPREDGSSEPPAIMAYQGSQIVELSPDYMNAVPIAADGATSRSEPALACHSRFSSDRTTSSAAGRDSTDSHGQLGESYHPPRRSSLEHRSWMPHESITPECDRLQLHRRLAAQIMAAYRNHRSSCVPMERPEQFSVVGHPREQSRASEDPRKSSTTSGRGTDYFSAAHATDQSSQSRAHHGPCRRCGFDDDLFRRIMGGEIDSSLAPARADCTCFAKNPLQKRKRNNTAVSDRAHELEEGSTDGGPTKPKQQMVDIPPSVAPRANTTHDAARQSLWMKLGGWFRALVACLLCRR